MYESLREKKHKLKLQKTYENESWLVHYWQQQVKVFTLGI